MVRIDRVHTGGGDKGESSLVDGSRRLKSDVRFSVVGDCDELNSIVGLVRMNVHDYHCIIKMVVTGKMLGAFISSAILPCHAFNTSCLISVQNWHAHQKIFPITWSSSMKTKPTPWFLIWMHG